MTAGEQIPSTAGEVKLTTLIEQLNACGGT